MPAAVAAVRRVAPTWYSPPKKTRSGVAAAAAGRKSSKVVAPSGTICCTLTVPPAAVNAVANASARPFDTAFVSLTIAAFEKPSARACAERNAAWCESGATRRK